MKCKTKRCNRDAMHMGYCEQCLIAWYDGNYQGVEDFKAGVRALFESGDLK